MTNHPRSHETSVQHHCPTCDEWYDCEMGDECTLLGVIEFECSKCANHQKLTQCTDSAAHGISAKKAREIR